MANSTLQMVAEALRESQDEDDGAWHFDCEAGAQAAISAFKQSDEWKGVVEAARSYLSYLNLQISVSSFYGEDALTEGALRKLQSDKDLAQSIYTALNKLNGGA